MNSERASSGRKRAPGLDQAWEASGVRLGRVIGRAFLRLTFYHHHACEAGVRTEPRAKSLHSSSRTV